MELKKSYKPSQRPGRATETKQKKKPEMNGTIPDTKADKAGRHTK